VLSDAGLMNSHEVLFRALNADEGAPHRRPTGRRQTHLAAPCSAQAVAAEVSAPSPWTTVAALC
jgi:hypothetical protein